MFLFEFVLGAHNAHADKHPHHKTQHCHSHHKEFNKHYTYQQLEHAISRAQRVLCEHKDKMVFQVLVLTLSDLNIINLSAKEWTHEAPVSKLLKYDLPLTFMSPTDPMTYSFIKYHACIHTVLLNPKSTDCEIREAWDKWEHTFNEKGKEAQKVRMNFIRAFEINESSPKEQWIRHHLHSMVCFDKCFWEEHKNIERISNLARGMLALYENNIDEAKKYLQAYKEDEMKRLPECKKEG